MYPDGSYGISVWVFEKPPSHFPWWLYQFAVPSADTFKYEGGKCGASRGLIPGLTWDKREEWLGCYRVRTSAQPRLKAGIPGLWLPAAMYFSWRPDLHVNLSLTCPFKDRRPFYNTDCLIRGFSWEWKAHFLVSWFGRWVLGAGYSCGNCPTHRMNFEEHFCILRCL